MIDIDALEAAVQASFDIRVREIILTLTAELRAARRVIEAAKSIESEIDVRDLLCCFSMGIELMARLNAYDAVCVGVT